MKLCVFLNGALLLFIPLTSGASTVLEHDLGHTPEEKACDELRRELAMLLRIVYDKKAWPNSLKKVLPNWVESYMPANCGKRRSYRRHLSRPTTDTSGVLAMSSKTRHRREVAEDGNPTVLYRQKRFLAAGPPAGAPDFSSMMLGSTNPGPAREISESAQMMNNLLMLTKLQKTSVAREFRNIGRTSYVGDRVSFGSGMYGDTYPAKRKREADNYNDIGVGSDASLEPNVRRKRFLFQMEPTEFLQTPSLFSIYQGTAVDPNTGKRLEFSGDVMKNAFGSTLMSFLPPGFQPPPGKDPGDMINTMAPLLLNNRASPGSAKKKNRNGLFGDTLPGKRKRKRSPDDSNVDLLRFGDMSASADLFGRKGEAFPPDPSSTLLSSFYLFNHNSLPPPKLLKSLGRNQYNNNKLRNLLSSNRHQSFFHIPPHLLLGRKKRSVNSDVVTIGDVSIPLDFFKPHDKYYYEDSRSEQDISRPAPQPYQNNTQAAQNAHQIHQTYQSIIGGYKQALYNSQYNNLYLYKFLQKPVVQQLAPIVYQNPPVLVSHQPRYATYLPTITTQPRPLYHLHPFPLNPQPLPLNPQPLPLLPPPPPLYPVNQPPPPYQNAIPFTPGQYPTPPVDPFLASQRRYHRIKRSDKSSDKNNNFSPSIFPLNPASIFAPTLYIPPVYSPQSTKIGRRAQSGDVIYGDVPLWQQQPTSNLLPPLLTPPSSYPTRNTNYASSPSFSFQRSLLPPISYSPPYQNVIPFTPGQYLTPPIDPFLASQRRSHRIKRSDKSSDKNNFSPSIFPLNPTPIFAPTLYIPPVYSPQSTKIGRRAPSGDVIYGDVPLWQQQPSPSLLPSPLAPSSTYSARNTNTYAFSPVLSFQLSPQNPSHHSPPYQNSVSFTPGQYPTPPIDPFLTSQRRSHRIKRSDKSSDKNNNFSPSIFPLNPASIFAPTLYIPPVYSPQSTKIGRRAPSGDVIYGDVPLWQQQPSPSLLPSPLIPPSSYPARGANSYASPPAFSNPRLQSPLAPSSSYPARNTNSYASLPAFSNPRLQSPLAPSSSYPARNTNSYASLPAFSNPRLQSLLSPSSSYPARNTNSYASSPAFSNSRLPASQPRSILPQLPPVAYSPANTSPLGFNSAGGLVYGDRLPWEGSGTPGQYPPQQVNIQTQGRPFG